MNKWLISLLLFVISITVILWAFSPLLITYARVLPEGLVFDIGNKESVESAIIQIEHRAIEEFREMYGKSILALSILSLFNVSIATFYILKIKKDNSTN